MSRRLNQIWDTFRATSRRQLSDLGESAARRGLPEIEDYDPEELKPKDLEGPAKAALDAIRGMSTSTKRYGVKEPGFRERFDFAAPRFEDLTTTDRSTRMRRIDVLDETKGLAMAAPSKKGLFGLFGGGKKKS